MGNCASDSAKNNAAEVSTVSEQPKEVVQKPAEVVKALQQEPPKPKEIRIVLKKDNIELLKKNS